ncbi:MAG: hypothetical protein O7C75_11345 [Verrucomicrobia bacterium]|nr:hypothetical protein [Verrucomicrobiota bacterium]
MNWPNKTEREELEIAGFIEAYVRLPENQQLEVLSKGEKPDFVVRDKKNNGEYGVELTSVYLDDRSVPDVHMKDEERIVEIPYNEDEVEKYMKGLVGAVIDKVCKARKGYDSSRPLILAIYVNEYISIYLGKSELEELVLRYEGVFDAMVPFKEVVFWNLGHGGAFRVTPS